MPNLAAVRGFKGSLDVLVGVSCREEPGARTPHVLFMTRQGRTAGSTPMFSYPSCAGTLPFVSVGEQGQAVAL